MYQCDVKSEYKLKSDDKEIGTSVTYLIENAYKKYNDINNIVNVYLQTPFYERPSVLHDIFVENGYYNELEKTIISYMKIPYEKRTEIQHNLLGAHGMYAQNERICGNLTIMLIKNAIKEYNNMKNSLGVLLEIDPEERSEKMNDILKKYELL